MRWTVQFLMGKRWTSSDGTSNLFTYISVIIDLTRINKWVVLT